MIWMYLTISYERRKNSMNKHRKKCEHLKEIRKNVAEAIGVELNQSECTYEGDCKGTCPKCRQEEQKLSKALLAGSAVAAGMALMLSGCTNQVEEPEELAGDVAFETEIEDEQKWGFGKEDLELSGMIEPIE